jgi:hypothetical protein
MKKLFHKLVQGVTTAATAVTAAFLGVAATTHSFAYFDTWAALRVGAPAFVVGMLFFPLNVRTLSNRWRFVGRAVFAAVVSSLVHRTLLASFVLGPDFVLHNPDVLVPFSFDSTLQLAMMATAGAGLAAWLFQPALLRLARGALPARIERISQDMQALHVRHRVH